LDDVVAVSGDSDGFLAETRGADLGGNAPREWTGGALLDPGPDESENGLSPGAITTTIVRAYL